LPYFSKSLKTYHSETWKKDFIGIVKNWFGDRDCVKEFHTASLYVLARFALYNLILLYKLLSFFVDFWRVGLLLVFLSFDNFFKKI